MSPLLLVTAVGEPLRVIVEKDDRVPFWRDPPYLALLVSLVVVAVTVWAASREALRSRAMQRRHELARCYGDALADALAWCELPYRVARRTSDAPETLADLADKFHQLQERIEHHRRWLQLESDSVCAAYAALVAGVKERARGPIAAAWRRPPIGVAADMVFDVEDAFRVDVEDECKRYVELVCTELDQLTPSRWFGRGT
jgi:hypothetical protein